MALGREWMEEFEVMKTMQEERLEVAASLACQDKCVKSYWTLNMPPWEAQCMKTCLQKYAEGGLIANFNIGKFGILETPKGQKKKSKLEMW